MLNTEFASSLRSATTTFQFVQKCTEYANNSQFVSLNEKALEPLVDAVRRAPSVSFENYLRHPEGSIDDGVFDMTFNAALNGGYFQESASGDVVQWNRGGSGSDALKAWIGSLIEDHVLPGVDLLTPEAAIEAITPRVMGLPLARERVLICEQFVDQIRLARPQALVISAQTVNGYAFGLREARALSEIYPAAFVQDPFLKKAILALQMLTQHMVAARDISVDYDLPIPSDYQIPRYLAFIGAIVPSPEAVEQIRSGRLLPVEGDVVTAMRAAAISLSHRLGEVSGVPDYVIDGVLFTSCRKDPEVKARALPPMRCSSLWF